MTKAQGSRLTPETVVATALRLLDERGLEAVTTRAVAEALGVRMNTVLWHIKNKARLLELMADAVVGEVAYDGLPEDGTERARELLRRYRRALLAHRDGAALVTGTYAADPGTLRFADAVLAALTARGDSAEAGAWTLFALIYFTLGLTQEEQAVSSADEPRLHGAVLAGEYPALQRALPHLTGNTFEDRFSDGLNRILG
ncbi:TetR/AcrR family transcriptional regulator, tetracycline repressor protein [Amycolatopsis sacchari]|uniref:TetR/AcrR family transcriptional regulator, tetracycline repressor protein n=1 Tax=Amycolatopsis sacchari TaxID=115433 RepID=A0A1I3SXQ5_9PSEU|nr:TetR/AcrR family transcriptional regulator C-terminal domain-containing protein [Amycolatopsis sacchari]SFJ62639.1 TetR/AcrR family transcriptional regulator, tetracycline repressor protein [Amycolatopsis sacchari]